MNELVPIVQGIAGTLTAQKISKSAGELMAAYFGHKGETFATIAGDYLRRKRENAEKVVTDSHFILLNLGLQMKDFDDIPLGISEPILEGASQAEDDSLRKRWSYLLANVGDPRSLRNVLPSFATILKDLMPNDAIFLDRLYGHQHVRLAPTYAATWNYDLERLYPHKPDFDLASRRIDEISEPLQITLDSLGRHLLVEKKLSVFLPHSDMPDTQQGQVVAKYVMSALGKAFVEACRPPEPPKATSE